MSELLETGLLPVPEGVDPKTGPLDNGIHQGPQHLQSPLARLVSEVYEPALIHSNGQILVMNAAFARLIGHGRPSLLQGLPIQAVLAPSAEDSLVDVQTALGPVPHHMHTMEVALTHDEGTLCAFSPPRHHGPPRPSAASFREQSWNAGISDLESPLHATIDDDDDDVDPPDLGSAVEHAMAWVPRLRVGLTVRAKAPTVGTPAQVASAARAILRAARHDVSVVVDVDVAGHPCLVVHCAFGVLDEDQLRNARREIQSLRGSLTTLDDGRTVRARLAAAHPPRHLRQILQA